MGITALIPSMTIGQLRSEAIERWQEMWDSEATRTKILLMCPRKERKMMELHGDMIEHGQPVLTIFHRPRAEAPLLEQQGFDPRAASFQFVDLATPDMGPWMQQLISNEKWLRSTVDICPTPFDVDIPNQRGFETERVMCFRHPSLPPLEKYFLPFPIDSIAGKCYVSLPRRQAAEMARQQAEVLGVGRLEKKANITQVAQPAPAPTPEPEPAPVAAAPAPVESVPVPKPAAEPAMDSLVDGFTTDLLASVTHNAGDDGPSPSEGQEEHKFVPLPPGASPAPAPPASPSPAPTPAPTPQAPTEVESAPVEEEVVEESAPMSDVEIEFRELVSGLLSAGVEPSDMMDDPRWEDINERAMAAGFETWPVFIELTTMG